MRSLYEGTNQPMTAGEMNEWAAFNQIRAEGNEERLREKRVGRGAEDIVRNPTRHR